MSKVGVFYLVGLLVLYLVYGYLFYENKKFHPEISSETAVNVVKNLPEVQEFFRLSPDPHLTIENIDEVSNVWNIHVYEDFPDHTVTFNWYEVNKRSGELSDRVTTLSRDPR